jgi:hypothetical protein
MPLGFFVVKASWLSQNWPDVWLEIGRKLLGSVWGGCLAVISDVWPCHGHFFLGVPQVLRVRMINNASFEG